ncbi:hypothetical protein I316_00301 [Kwoniella heveanensis BCC8398]|uniref:Uncharacterized protein n=1 Tax=Kwoniella heveanensis BCC8398 TaxID=1296120 RepID=A0A1B9H478_9TREE|nr:hypothetical protein I316_00301 [Kwoniella heveanensis BCC8398]
MSGSSTDRAPVKPIKFEPNHIYLQVSFNPSSSSSNPVPPTNIVHSSLSAKYLGPVGELKGEGIYQVVQADDGSAVRRDALTWSEKEKEVVAAVKKSEGVKGVKVMPELKQRAKRDEF